MKSLFSRRIRKCRSECRNLLSQYLDGELDADKNGAVQAHLLTCVVCRNDCEQLRLVKTAVLRLAVPKPPENNQRFSNWSMPIQSRPRSLTTDLLHARIQVPIPIAGVGLIVLMAAILMVVRTQSGNGSAQREASGVNTITRIVEVPKEHIVTRTVYVGQPRKRHQLTPAKHRVEPIAEPPGISGIARGNSTPVIPSYLEGFRPPGDPNLRVVKEREQ